jgi:Fe-S oxidoreductase
LRAARNHAERVLQSLKRIDPDGSIPVVGIEPPEIYCLKNDYVDLLPERRPEISLRTQNVWLLEEFLIRSKAMANVQAAALEGVSRPKIEFHPHCHQRAEGPANDGLPNGVNATIESLRACGYRVELIEAGCCGMAGTFGYEAEHYRLSQQVGELKLLPYIRTLGVANRESVIASTGAACRMQIEQGAGVRAEHPIVLVARAIRGSSKA